MSVVCHLPCALTQLLLLWNGEPRPSGQFAGFTPPTGIIMETINIQFTLFSAFYSPLIATFAGGFLKQEGLHADWSVAPPGQSALESLKDGSAHLVQSALSQGFTAIANGEKNNIRHFAQVNEMDGFFITSKQPDDDFQWKKLEGSRVILFGGGQPLVMFKYACHRAGISFDKLDVVNVGGAKDMDDAFRAGEGDYVQQQGPFPQQLVADGVGHVVAKVGEKVGVCGFSSLAADREWLQTGMAQAFMRAYKKARLYMNEASAEEIAASQKEYFPAIDLKVLSDCIGTYQTLGNWSPHVDITHSAYEATLDIYEYAGGLSVRHPYESVCTKPPLS